MCLRTIIQLACTAPAEHATSSRTARGGLPETRRHNSTMACHPARESRLPEAPKAPKAAAEKVSILLRDILENRRRQLSSPLERIQKEEAHGAISDQLR